MEKIYYNIYLRQIFHLDIEKIIIWNLLKDIYLLLLIIKWRLHKDIYISLLIKMEK
jgi:hypothetical protein